MGGEPGRARTVHEVHEAEEREHEPATRVDDISGRAGIDVLRGAILHQLLLFSNAALIVVTTVKAHVGIGGTVASADRQTSSGSRLKCTLPVMARSGDQLWG